MRTLLINPGFGPLVSRGRHNRPWPPLDLLNCAAVLEEQGQIAELLDLRARPRPLEEIREMAARADLVFLTFSPLDRWQCPNLELEPALELAARLPRERLFAAGAQASLFPREMLAATEAKGVIRGEYEEIVGELAQGLALDQIPGLTWQGGEEVRTNPDRSPADIDQLPLPAYHLLDLADYSYELLGPRLGLVETARGCPFHCPFCLKAMYPPGLRTKPAARVLEEVRRLIKDHGAGCIYFFDLEFTARRDFTIELCEGLAKGSMVPWTCQTRLDALDPELVHLMAEAGCALIHVGIETADPALQERSRKPIDPARAKALLAQARRAGIRTAAFFLLGLPGQTPAQAVETVDLAKRLEPTYASFHLHTPYPGTPWGAQAESWSAWAQERQRQEDQWAGEIKKAYRRFYLRPAYLGRALAGPGGLRQGLNLFRRLAG